MCKGYRDIIGSIHQKMESIIVYYTCATYSSTDVQKYGTLCSKDAYSTVGHGTVLWIQYEYRRSNCLMFRIEPFLHTSVRNLAMLLLAIDNSISHVSIFDFGMMGT